MNEIWANRLIGGTKLWEDVPTVRKVDVKNVLLARVEKGEVTAEQYKAITGEDYSA